MKKLKDFIYDYNDVLVALLIVAVAGLIIFWRVNVVMSYAEFAGTGPVKQIDINFSDIDLNKESVDPETNPQIENNDDNPSKSETQVTGGAVEATQPAIETATKPAVEPKQEPVDTTKKYTLNVSKETGLTSWGKVETKLKSEGIIKATDKLGTRVHERELDASLQIGKFDLNSGMTLDEIINILTGK